MKKLFLLISLIILGFGASAQTGSPLKMVNFHRLPNEIADLKVLKDECGRDCDLDNNKAALIRVKAQGFSEKTMLEFNLVARPGIEIIHKKYKDGEMWLYVSSNCQGTIVIKYKGEYEFKLPSKLEAKGVYELVLGMETGTIVIRAIPSNADIFVDNEKVGAGEAIKSVSIGAEHRYRVVCEDYYTKEGVVYFDKREEKSVNVELEPNFGYITIKSEPGGAEIYVDDVNVGTTPYLMKKIKLGRHTVEIRKYGYETQADMVMIKVDEVNKQLENVKLVEDKSVAQQPVPVTPVAAGSSTNGTSATTASGNRTFTVNGVSFEMVEVKGGTFTMGSDDSDAYSWEKPMHRVTVSDFMIGKFEVTQKLWKAVMGSNPSRFKGDNLPVENVSWNDAREFIRKLNQQTGQNFRLPTEAEWEYAARGGTSMSLYNGEKINLIGANNSPNLDKLAWYGGNCGQNYTSYAGCDVANGYDISGWSEKQYADSKGGTHPVGLKQPNAYGLYDMLGNVWEWCQDWYGDYSSGSQTNPTGPSSGSYRVLRGGSWHYGARYCRVSDRSINTPDDRSLNLGFRLVLVP